MRKLLAAVGAAALVLVVLAGCGSSSSSSSTASTGSTTSSTATAAANPAIAAEVPAAVKSKGTLTVAADASYAPNEFIAPDGHTVIGMDADLANALFPLLGSRSTFVNATFDTIIPGPRLGQVRRRHVVVHRHQGAREDGQLRRLLRGRHVVLREELGQPAASSTVADLCGLTVSVETGTTEQADADSAEQEVHQRRQEGRHRADVPDAVRREPRALQRPRAGRHGRLAGRRLPGQAVQRQVQARRQGYGVAPYGIAVPKADGTLDRRSSRRSRTSSRTASTRRSSRSGASSRAPTRPGDQRARSELAAGGRQRDVLEAEPAPSRLSGPRTSRPSRSADPGAGSRRRSSSSSRSRSSTRSRPTRTSTGASSAHYLFDARILHGAASSRSS